MVVDDSKFRLVQVNFALDNQDMTIGHVTSKAPISGGLRGGGVWLVRCIAFKFQLNTKCQQLYQKAKLKLRRK